MARRPDQAGRALTAEPTSASGSESSTAEALAAAGDHASARDIGALDAAALAVERKLAATRTSLVERLIYGPAPSADELQSGGRLARSLDAQRQPIVDAALGCLARGEAFSADGKLAAALRASGTGGMFSLTTPRF